MPLPAVCLHLSGLTVKPPKPRSPCLAGLVTLMCVVLVAVNFRMILENMLKYGLRFNPLTFLRNALTPSGGCGGWRWGRGWSRGGGT